MNQFIIYWDRCQTGPRRPGSSDQRLKEGDLVLEEAGDQKVFSDPFFSLFPFFLRQGRVFKKEKDLLGRFFGRGMPISTS
jgi:hypothetical protein